jgi:hypothetical protein
MSSMIDGTLQKIVNCKEIHLALALLKGHVSIKYLQLSLLTRL